MPPEVLSTTAPPRLSILSHFPCSAPKPSLLTRGTADVYAQIDGNILPHMCALATVSLVIFPLLKFHNLIFFRPCPQPTLEPLFRRLRRILPHAQTHLWTRPTHGINRSMG